MVLRFEETRSFCGFYGGSTPAFQMVPKNGERTILVRDSLNCKIELVPDNKNVLRIDFVRSGNDTRIRLKGQGRDGTVQLKVQKPATGNGSEQEITMDVCVKDRKLISVAFIYMKTGGPEETQRNPSDTSQLRSAINNILEMQANLRVEFYERSNGGADPFVFLNGPDVGPEIDHSEHHNYVNILGPNENPDFQFVFVHEFAGDREGEVVDGYKSDTEAGTAYGCCVMQDPKPGGASQGILLSHELGHHILRHQDGDGHHDDSNNLMYFAATSSNLTAEQINIFNPSGLGVPTRGNLHKPSRPAV